MLIVTVNILSMGKTACDGVKHHRNGNQVVGVSTVHTVQIRTMTQMETGATYRVPHMEKAGIIAQRVVRRLHHLHQHQLRQHQLFWNQFVED